MKLHFTLDHDGYLPTALVITEGKRHDVTVARQQTFEPGTILVFDRGSPVRAAFTRDIPSGIHVGIKSRSCRRFDQVCL